VCRRFSAPTTRQRAGGGFAAEPHENFGRLTTVQKERESLARMQCSDISSGEIQPQQKMPGDEAKEFAPFVCLSRSKSAPVIPDCQTSTETRSVQNSFKLEAQSPSGREHGPDCRMRNARVKIPIPQDKSDHGRLIQTGGSGDSLLENSDRFARPRDSINMHASLSYGAEEAKRKR
jgi:hypothetical protein